MSNSPKFNDYADVQTLAVWIDESMKRTNE